MSISSGQLSIFPRSPERKYEGEFKTKAKKKKRKGNLQITATATD